jgi:D-methionine transport system substrate-binding protein
VELKVKVFTDYIQPNVQVAEKRLDANFFQHQPYLDEFNKAKGTNLVSVTGVHIEPLGAYSARSRSSTSCLRRHRGDPQRRHQRRPRPAAAGQGRRDQAEGQQEHPVDRERHHRNDKDLKFRELEAATIPRVLTQVDLALINTNYALEAKLNPRRTRWPSKAATRRT